jgi:diguanylate cyclase (GGDEF)-like protein
MGHRSRIRQAANRLGTSWLLVVLGVAVLGAAGAGALEGVVSQAHNQTVSGALAEAQVIARLTVERNVISSDTTSPLASSGSKDLDGDFVQLAKSKELLGLEVWRPNGSVLYRYGTTQSALVSGPDLASAAAGRAIVHFDSEPARPGAPTAVAEVLVPLPAFIGRQGRFVAGELLPSRLIVADASWAIDRLAIGTAVAMALSVLWLWRLRRRLRSQAYQAWHDHLTGLGNGALLDDAAGRALAAEGQACLVLMDLDGFKRVNDTLGHAAGDELLGQLALRLRSSTRPGDALVRLGGDEFAVLMPGVGPEGAQRAGERLLEAATGQFVVRGVLVDTEASVGVAVAPGDGKALGELLQAADIAMYQAKRGKLGVCTFSENSRDVDAGELELLVQLRAAIGAGQLRLHYQPTVALQAGAAEGVEALVRWEHPQRGLLAPGQFVPLAEDTALIHPLTAWVLDEAVRQCAAWRLDGLFVAVAVNISARSLTRHGLVELVSETLARHQLPASALHVEVTESAIIARPEMARQVLNQLQARGISIAIDDFGTGYTSLAHLKTLPVEVLKIDRAFVSHLVDGSADRAIVSSIIGLGHGLGMQLVAEGIEDGATMEMLRALGCDIAQGFHISRPMTSDDAGRWLSRRANGPDFVQAGPTLRAS